jgi:small GTP-binding protein
MIKKKVCLIGAYAVGKTSLVRRFVSGLFSDQYLTTIGVKIDQRTVMVGDSEMRLMIWDLAGRDEFESVRKSYLAGAAGFIYVADGTRRETLAEMKAEKAEIDALYPGIPSILLVNKRDLISDWEIDDGSLAALESAGLPVLLTSALTGDNVAEAFDRLAAGMAKPH